MDVHVYNVLNGVAYGFRIVVIVIVVVDAVDLDDDVGIVLIWYALVNIGGLSSCRSS